MYASRSRLEEALFDVLEEELPEKNTKEVDILVDAVIATLDGEFLDIVEEDDDEDDDYEEADENEEEYDGN